MKLPEKIKNIILAEAKKNAQFSWYQGWERTSGFIKSRLIGDCRFGECRLYIKWEKKKPPLPEQIDREIELLVDRLLNCEEHSSTQRDFRHYVMETFFRDMNKARHDLHLHIEDMLPEIISMVEKSENFVEVKMQHLHNELKNFECAISEYESISQFLDKARGES